MGSVEQAIENASTFTGTRNADWQPFSHVFSDGVERVLVPVGCFMIGSNNGEDNEQPVHEQCVTEPFWLDKYEVTNALYGSVGCRNNSSAADRTAQLCRLVRRTSLL
jgi:formylglycine-generating enzyme required for sulfatase activity